PHRDDDGVDAVLLEPGVADQRRFERVRGVAQVRDECGRSADHRVPPSVPRPPCSRSTGGPSKSKGVPASCALLKSSDSRTPVHAHRTPPCTAQYSSQWASLTWSRSRPRLRSRSCSVLGETRTTTTSTSIGGQSKRSAAAVMKLGSDR